MNARSTVSRGTGTDGWVILDKPVGVTSTRAVSMVRRAYATRKAGHAGTLDPAASGVLPIALGAATKTVPYVMNADKSYRFTMRIGQETDTDDGEGSIVDESSSRPTDEDLRQAAADFVGEIDQTPPAYSAIKIDGKRAYALARSGKTPEVSARKVRIDRIALLERPDPDHAEFEMDCGKGAYVRALARDLGRVLGCLGHASAIRRLQSGPFSLDQAVTLDELDSSDGDELARHLLKPEAGLAGIPRVDCTPAEAALVKHGGSIPCHGSQLQPGTTVWIADADRLIAIASVRDDRLHPARVLVSAGS